MDKDSHNKTFTLTFTASTGTITLDSEIYDNTVILETVCIQNVANGAANPIVEVDFPGFSTAFNTSFNHQSRLILYNDTEKKTTIYTPHLYLELSRKIPKTFVYKVYNSIDNDQPTFGAGNEILYISLVFSYSGN